MSRTERLSVQVDLPTIKVIGVSDPGLVRPHNEDTIFIDDRGNFVLLADGMGGHERGEEASAMAVEIVQEFLHPEILLDELADITDAEGIPTELICLSSLVEDAVRKANEDIYARNQQTGLKRFMGTTLVGLVPIKEDMLWFHVGDSRMYLWRDSALKQLTVDHSAHSQWERDGRAGMEPAKHVITRAVGPNQNTTVDIGYGKWQKNDLYILCSDGLSDMVTNDTIARIIGAEEGVERIANALVDAALGAGGKDNVSVVVCQV